MKTAVSIPDQTFSEAERLAKSLRLSRSRLYVTALDEYMKRHSRKGITEALNAVYGREDSSLDPVLVGLQRRSLLRETV